MKKNPWLVNPRNHQHVMVRVIDVDGYERFGLAVFQTTFYESESTVFKVQGGYFYCSNDELQGDVVDWVGFDYVSPCEVEQNERDKKVEKEKKLAAQAKSKLTDEEYQALRGRIYED